MNHGGSKIVYESGSDVSILTYGYMVYPAIEAAKELKEVHGINARVVNMYSLRPLDEDTILKCSQDSKFILTVEEHFKYGGLHSLVSQYLSQHNPSKVLSISMTDYAESGTTEELVNKYGLNSANIVKTTLGNI